jgi:phosphatidylserine decarboxylase
MKIHREGYSILLITALLLFILNYLFRAFITDIYLYQNLFLFASIVFYILVLQFFRDPTIRPVKDENLILAPADGKVVVIEETDVDEFIQEKRIQVSIFMSPLNVHINRNPVGGILKYFKYHPGKYLVAWHPKSSSENERTTLVYELSNGLLLPVRQIAGAMARRIKCYIRPGEPVEQGTEFGFIRFGSRLDVFLPLDGQVEVKIGDKTTAGETVLCRLSSKRPD